MAGGIKQIDLAGKKFGRLTALKVSDRPKSGTPYYWHCVCECGSEVEVVSQSLRRGSTTSCGCYQRERVKVQRSEYTAVGFRDHPLHVVWLGMIQRCNNPRSKAYKDYGGRGIAICERWKRFENFAADMGDRPDGMTIERVDVNGNYEPGNCKWATHLEQVRNRRVTTYVELDGERVSLSECAERFGISKVTLRWRLYRAGWTIEEALELVPHPDLRKPVIGSACEESGRDPITGNPSGFAGVSKNGKKWRAKITVKRKQISLGTYETPEEAHQVFLKAKEDLSAGSDAISPTPESR